MLFVAQGGATEIFLLMGFLIFINISIKSTFKALYFQGTFKPVAISVHLWRRL